MRTTSLLGLLVVVASIALVAFAAIGLAHSALDSREVLLVAMGFAGLALLPLGLRGLHERAITRAHA